MISKYVAAKDDVTAPHAISALRRDVAFIGNAVIVVVFVCFAGLAVASALIDLIAIRQ